MMNNCSFQSGDPHVRLVGMEYHEAGHDHLTLKQGIIVCQPAAIP